MKEKICLYDVDNVYGKKFCNTATKILGDNFIFMYFKNIKALKEFATENKIIGIICPTFSLEEIREIDVDRFYALSETNVETYEEGKTKFIYKYQKLNNILKIIDRDRELINGKDKIISGKSKLVIFYTEKKISKSDEIIKKIAKSISKTKTVLLIYLDEFENYKSYKGISNIIYLYKENNLNIDGIRHEIELDKMINVDTIHSVTYPDDFNVITNIDLSNIVNYIRNLDYDYLLISTDESYVKNQYVLQDADLIITIRDENISGNIFKSYIKSQNIININKITEFVVDKTKRNQVSAFVKGLINGK